MSLNDWGWLLAGLACGRWYYWRREAFRTRDAALAQFEAIRKAVRDGRP